MIKFGARRDRHKAEILRKRKRKMIAKKGWETRRSEMCKIKEIQNETR